MIQFIFQFMVWEFLEDFILFAFIWKISPKSNSMNLPQCVCFPFDYYNFFINVWQTFWGIFFDITVCIHEGITDLRCLYSKYKFMLYGITDKFDFDWSKSYLICHHEQFCSSIELNVCTSFSCFWKKKNSIPFFLYIFFFVNKKSKKMNNNSNRRYVWIKISFHNFLFAYFFFPYASLPLTSNSLHLDSIKIQFTKLNEMYVDIHYVTHKKYFFTRSWMILPSGDIKI